MSKTQTLDHPLPAGMTPVQEDRIIATGLRLMENREDPIRVVAYLNDALATLRAAYASPPIHPARLGKVGAA